MSKMIGIFVVSFILIIHGASAQVVENQVRDALLEKIPLTTNLDRSQDLKLMVNDLIMLRQGVSENRTTEFIFILSNASSGIDGKPVEKTGFPPALSSRTALIKIVRSSANQFSTTLYGTSSNGFPAQDIQGTAVYNAQDKSLKLVFTYQKNSSGFITGRSLASTEFDINSPQMSSKSAKLLTHTITIIVTNFNPDDDLFIKKYFQGTYSEAISGGINSDVQNMIQGIVVAILD